MSHGRGPGRFLKEKQARKRSNTILLKKLANYLSPYKFQLMGVSFFILTYTIIMIINPIIISKGIDELVKSNPSPNVVLVLAIVFATLGLLGWIINGLNQWFLSSIKANFVHDIRKDVFSHLLKADILFHRREQSGNVTARVTGDTEELASGIAVVSEASTQILMVFSMFFVLVITSPIIAVISLISIPVAGLFAAILGTIGRRRMYAVRKAYGQVSGKMAEALAGIGISKAFNQEEWMSNQLYELNQKQYHYMKKLAALFTVLFPLISMVGTIMTAATLVAGGWLTLNQAGFTVGSIYLSILLVQRFLSPVLHIAGYWTQIQSSLAAMDRISDVLDAKNRVVEDPQAEPLKDNYSITFDNVSFEYVKGTEVLKNVSFKINEGEKVAIVGHTGAGKTTLAGLIARFFDPTSGTIMIGDQDLRKVTLESINKSIGLIPQEPYLFADNVIENIRYGRPDATDEEVFTICKLIGADRFIEALPDSFNTILKESGKNLSAGQRQMITIARTMLANPKILILDEATSRLDAYSESLVQLAQQQLFEGRTTLVIAHRLSTIRDVDKILVFENGSLVEFGTHDELMKLNGVYADLYRTFYAHQGVKEIDDAMISAVEKVVHEDETMEIPETMMKKMRAKGFMKPGMNPEIMMKHRESMMKKKMKGKSSSEQ